MAGRKIAQYDLSGDLVKIWDCLQEVTLDISSSALRKACREEYGICGGYRWIYEDRIPLPGEVWSHCLWNKEIIWVSNMGRIQSDDGYYRTRFKNKRILVHILVCLAFKGRPKSGRKFDVKHIDGNRANNRSENLKWVSRSELISESLRSPRPVNQYDKSGLFLKSFSSATEASQITGIKRIGRVCAGYIKSAGGYIWKYADQTE